MKAVKDGNHIRIYDAFLIRESIKEIPGRFYDPDDKAWLVPLSPENAATLKAGTGKQRQPPVVVPKVPSHFQYLPRQDRNHHLRR